MTGPPSKENSMDSNGSLPGRNGSLDRKASPSPYRSEFFGKIAVVTGATRALGRQVALSFGREGSLVAIQGMALDKLTSTKDAIVRAGVDERRVMMFVGDLRDENTAQCLFERTLQKFGKIDTLVIVSDPLESGADLGDNFADNTKNLVQLGSFAVRHLAKTRGSIVALSAMAMAPNGKHSFAPWRAISIGALEKWTQSVALFQGQKGIRVNAVNVGPLRLDFRSRQTNSSENGSGDEFPNVSNALMRPGTVEEVANVVLFLASSRASFVTGQVINADGGMEI